MKQNFILKLLLVWLLAGNWWFKTTGVSLFALQNVTQVN